MNSSPTQVETPAHLDCLVPSEWGAWRWFLLRGAGFPAHLIKELSLPDCAAAAEAFLSAERRVDDEFAAAVTRVDAVLDRLKAEGHESQGEAFRSVLRARRRLVEKKVPQNVDLPTGLGQELEGIRAAILQQERFQSEFEAAFSAGALRQSEALQRLAGNALFQEAVAWQNRPAFETTVRPLCVHPRSAPRNQRQRHREQIVAKYAQRYCLKNDTIGFFGPAVWAHLEPGNQPFKAVPGASLLGSRRTYFEAWAIDALAASLSLIEGMAWWIPPRIVPDAHIENARLHRPGSVVQLTAFESAVLQLCDGTRLPDEILAKLRKSGQGAVPTKNELRDLLAAKAAEGILVWRFLVPVEVNSEINLRRQLQRITDVNLRDLAMERLDRLQAARERIKNAVGDPGKLSDALGQAEQIFVEATQSSGTRNPGATYGARTICYEDCRRDFSLQITPDLIKPILPALSLLFRSLRWLVRCIARELDGVFRSSFQELVGAKTARELSLLEWWLYTEQKLLKAPSISELEKLFSQKWAEILKIESGKGIVSFNSSRLTTAVEEMFPEIDSACPVRYFCPDLMLAAESVEAINRGDVLYVLGEIHSGKNTLGHAVLVEQHPNRQELLEATEWDWGTPRFKIVDTQQAETTTVRTSNALLCGSDYLVSTTPDSVAPGEHIAHPISEFIIREEDKELYAVSRCGGQRFHILEAFSDLFSSFVMNKGSWIPPLRYTPRILIDNLVIRRATWRFPANKLKFAMEKEESGRFLEARRWMKENGLPRRMFVRTATEVKPFYLDLDSPIFVEILSRAVRVANSTGEGHGEFAFSEMLPDHDQLWLRDANGMSYTSELRLAFVDLKARAAGVASRAAMS